VVEKRVLRRMFGPERQKYQKAGGNCIMRGFNIPLRRKRRDHFEDLSVDEDNIIVELK
jgi:hypothetical protein